MNKEAAIKRITFALFKGRRTFEQSDVMLIRKGKQKKIINTHIRAIFRECCIIMGGRNDKLKDQNGLDQKRSGSKETYQKKSCHGSKGPFQKHMAGQKFIYVK